MKKTILFLMIILLMMGVCGCGMRGKAKAKVDSMVRYINEKYTDDSFEFVNMSGGYLGSNTKKIYVKSEKYPEKEIRVICSEVDGNDYYSDTYLNVKFEEQTYEYIREALVSEYGENIYLKYIPDDSGSFENGSSNTTFEEYISESSSCIYFSAAVEGEVENEEETFFKIKEILGEAVVSADIYYVNTEESLEENALQIIKEKKYTKKLYIIKKNVNEYIKAEWTDGV